MRNKYGGYCYRCGGYVEAGDGHFERLRGQGWRVQHANCAVKYRGTNVQGNGVQPGKDRTAIVHSLTVAQKTALDKLTVNYSWFEESVEHALYSYLTDTKPNLTNLEFLEVLTVFSRQVQEQEEKK